MIGGVTIAIWPPYLSSIRLFLILSSSKIYNEFSAFVSLSCVFFSRVQATLYYGLSIHPSVRWSVRPSFGPSVGRLRVFSNRGIQAINAPAQRLRLLAGCQPCLFLSLLYFFLPFLGSGPDRGRSPVEWGDFPSVCLFVRSSPLWASQPVLRPS